MPDLKTLHDALEAAEAAQQAAIDALAGAIPDGAEFTTNATPVVIVSKVGNDLHRRTIQPLPGGAS